MIKNIFWFLRVSLYSVALSALFSNSFLVLPEKDALSAMQLPVSAKQRGKRHVSAVQGSTKIYPQTVTRSMRAVSVQSVALQKAHAVYQCRENNGQTLFSDQPCGDVQQVTPLDSLRPNIAEPFKRREQKSIYRTASRPKQAAIRNPANQQEINTRYDNLSRVINSLLKGDRKRLDNFRIKLNEDRKRALSMFAKSVNSYSINKRFDNLKRDIRRQEDKRGQIWVARQLLKYEQQRSQELYDGAGN